MDDTISRQAAISIADDYMTDEAQDIRDRIVLLPSAERRGRWISYEFGDEHWHKCSVCGTADEYINHLGLVAVRNYCPMCGAKMK